MTNIIIRRGGDIPFVVLLGREIWVNTGFSEKLLLLTPYSPCAII